MLRSLCLILSAMTLVLPAVHVSAQKQPNIILIFCDDLGFGDLGVHWQNQRAKNGKPAIRTPQIDAMAKQGVQMRHTYCPAPVCAPSRASLLLGVTQGHANVRNNQFDKALEVNHTLASVLGQAGYATAAFGKWGLQGRPAEGIVNKFPAHPMNRGFDYFFGYMRHKDGHMHYAKEDKKECYDGNLNISQQLDLCYTTDLFTARAKQWIVDQVKADKDEPFFVYLAHDTPHAILQNPPSAYPKGGGLNGGVQWLGKPGKMINTATGKYDGWMHPNYAKTDWPDQYKRYANSVQRIDDTVGDLLQLLRDLEIDDNTLVIFTSDNGPSKESYLKDKPYQPTFFEGFGPFDGIKRDLWEGGIRPGMIARWPGAIPEGRVNREPSTFADFMATFCDVANTPVPARSDGVSMLPAMTGRGEQQPANVYIEYFNNGRTPKYGKFEKSHAGRKRGEMQAIRIGEYIGVRYDIKAHADDFEIYRIFNDPKQKNDLAKKPGMAKLQQQMKDEVLRRRVVNDSAKRPYDDEPIPAVEDVKTEPGVSLRWIANRTVSYVPDPRSSEVDHSAKVEGIYTHGNDTDTDGTVSSSGYINVPTTGVYSFRLTTSDRAVFRLHHATIIDNDATFDKAQSKTATLSLEKGLHPILLSMNVDRGEETEFRLEWSGPGMKEMQPVPETAYSRDATE